jgi:hypothetical protein
MAGLGTDEHDVRMVMERLVDVFRPFGRLSERSPTFDVQLTNP